MDPKAALQGIIDAAQELASIFDNDPDAKSDRAWQLDEIQERVDALRQRWNIKTYPAT